MRFIISQSYYILSNICQIVWENRFRGDTYQRCLITVDGTDFVIQEPTTFSSSWYSHKFRGPGLRYEVGIAISTGDIVWYHGPFPCGAFPDLKIFRLKLKDKLGYAENVIADNGYRGDTRICTPNMANDHQHARSMALARARHETINHRLKTWASLKNVFRHDRMKHHLVFRSIICIEQICIENGRGPFQVTNYIDPVIA
jgi:DDE superfamily endonuclease